jgi:hypothetical protein
LSRSEPKSNIAMAAGATQSRNVVGYTHAGQLIHPSGEPLRYAGFERPDRDGVHAGQACKGKPDTEEWHRNYERRAAQFRVRCATPTGPKTFRNFGVQARIDWRRFNDYPRFSQGTTEGMRQRYAMRKALMMRLRNQMEGYFNRVKTGLHLGGRDASRVRYQDIEVYETILHLGELRFNALSLAQERFTATGQGAPPLPNGTLGPLPVQHQGGHKAASGYQRPSGAPWSRNTASCRLRAGQQPEPTPAPRHRPQRPAGRRPGRPRPRPVRRPDGGHPGRAAGAGGAARRAARRCDGVRRVDVAGRRRAGRRAARRGGRRAAHRRRLHEPPEGAMNARRPWCQPAEDGPCRQRPQLKLVRPAFTTPAERASAKENRDRQLRDVLDCADELDDAVLAGVSNIAAAYGFTAIATDIVDHAGEFSAALVLAEPRPPATTTSSRSSSSRPAPPPATPSRWCGRAPATERRHLHCWRVCAGRDVAWSRPIDCPGVRDSTPLDISPGGRVDDVRVQGLAETSAPRLTALDGRSGKWELDRWTRSDGVQARRRPPVTPPSGRKPCA